MGLVPKILEATLFQRLSGDITIVPPFKLSMYTNIISNPTWDTIKQFMEDALRCTWVRFALHSPPSCNLPYALAPAPCPLPPVSEPISAAHERAEARGRHQVARRQWPPADHPCTERAARLRCLRTRLALCARIACPDVRCARVTVR